MCALDLTDMHTLVPRPGAPLPVHTYQSNHSCTCYNQNIKHCPCLCPTGLDEVIYCSGGYMPAL